MAFAGDLTPTTWLGAGYSLDGTNHLIKLNENDAASNKLLKQLTDALANASTGDIRSVFFSLCEMMYQAYKTQAAASNRATQMTISRTLAGTENEQFTYTCQFNLVQPSTVLAFPAE